MKKKAITVPVLMYHKIGEPTVNKILNISESDFRKQIRFLHGLGYEAVTFAETVAGVYDDAPLPKKPLCLTFDDGYLGLMKHAKPILDEFGWKATLFIPTKWIGQLNHWCKHHEKPLSQLIGLDDIRELHKQGWEIAGHTHSHVHLDRIGIDEAEKEIAFGTSGIEAIIGRAPHTFCYPYGGYNQDTIALVKKYGYVGACTTKSGIAMKTEDPFLIPRVKIATRDGIAGLIYRMWIRPFLG